MANPFFSRKYNGGRDPKRSRDPFSDFLEGASPWDDSSSVPSTPYDFRPITPPRFPEPKAPAPLPQRDLSSYYNSTSPHRSFDPRTQSNRKPLEYSPTAPELPPLSQDVLKQRRRNYLLGHAVKSGLQTAFGGSPEPLNTQWLLAQYPPRHTPHEPLPPEPYYREVLPSPPPQTPQAPTTLHGTLRYQEPTPPKAPRHPQPGPGTLHYQRQYYQPDPTPPQSPSQKQNQHPPVPQSKTTQPLHWEGAQHPITPRPSASTSYPTTPLPPHYYVAKNSHKKTLLDPDKRERTLQWPLEIFIETTAKQLNQVIKNKYHLGEHDQGPKSNYPPKNITFHDEGDLAKKLWSHFVHGQGQPVILDMAQLDFSPNLNIHKALSKDAKRLLITHPLSTPNYKNTLEHLLKKRIKDHFISNNRLQHVIILEDNFQYFEPQLDPKKDPLRNPIRDLSLFLALGRIKFHLNNVAVKIDYSTRKIHFYGYLSSIENDKTIDLYNFDPDSTRDEQWNKVVYLVHEDAPQGSTSFKILGRGVSEVHRTYTFNAFLTTP